MPTSLDSLRQAFARHAPRLGIVAAVGGIVALALLIAFPPAGLLKNHIAAAIGEAIGRPVTLAGARLTILPELRLVLTGVTVADPPPMTGPDFLRIDEVEARIAGLRLLRGHLDIEQLTVLKPSLALRIDSAGNRNWATGGRAGHAPRLVLPRAATFSGGTLTYANERTARTFAADTIDGTLSADPATGKTEARASGEISRETFTTHLTIADARALAAGTRTPASAAFDSRFGNLALDGEAVLSDDPAIAGTLTVSTGSALEFVRWFGFDIEPGGTPYRVEFAGKVKASGNDIVVADTDLTVNSLVSRVDARLSLSGPRPKLEGTLAAERVDLTRFAPRPVQSAALAASDPGPVVTGGWELLIADLDTIERGPSAPSATASLALAAAPAPMWSEIPIRLTTLRNLDADVTITAAHIAYKDIDLRDALIAARIEDGRLAATLSSLAIETGKAAGSLTIDSRANPPAAAAELALTAVPAEPVITEIAGQPLLSGPSNVIISATARGQNPAELARTLAGRAKFDMGAGALKGFDIRRMISEWWRSWSFDLARQTGFSRLVASYDIRDGILRSAPDLALAGPEIEIRSEGSVSVPEKRLDQDVRLKVLAPPALPIPVRISGSWTRPSIGIDWAGLFSAAPGLGGPQAIAPPGPPPPEVQAAIRRVLAADLPPDRLTDQGRATLHALLPSSDP